jgi:DNA-binding response OmpR family regulator
MIPNRTVLIGLNDRPDRSVELRERFADWVERLGYEPAVATDGRTAVAWVEERPLAASLVDSDLLGDMGEEVWRRVRPILGRRLVLMAREPRSDIIFEALRSGVGALLPLPARECMVRAAIQAATRVESNW